MSKYKKNIGRLGEEIAVKYLLSQGYKILETNWYFKHKEIDILALDEEVLVVVEVKARSIKFYEDPAIIVNKRKQRFLVEAANQYIIIKNIDHEVRFDVVFIVLDGEDADIDHVKDAFYPLL